MMRPRPDLPPALVRPLARLCDDLRQIFAERLLALVAHGPRVRHPDAAGAGALPVSTLALVDGLSYQDLHACAQRAQGWRADGVAVPLLLGAAEFARSLDTFPVEYGDIIAHHVLVFGRDPFEGLRVPEEDLRRACEAWAKGILIQLREGFIEAGGDARRVAALIAASAPPFAALLAHVARLRGIATPGVDGLLEAAAGIPGLSAHVVARVAALEARPALDADTAASLLPAYLDAVDAIARDLDARTSR